VESNVKVIELVKVKDKEEGQVAAHDILKKIVDAQTLLALSGGTSMDYRKMIVEPSDILPGAITVVDERYGKPFHKESNELLLKNQGIKKFADDQCVEAHKILRGIDNIDGDACNFDETIKDLFKRFKKKVGVMGVGTNLHTAGIFPYSFMAQSPDLVTWDDVDDKFGKRISITLRALGEFTNFVIMMFGEEKKEALRIMLDEKENDMQKHPAIFYRKVPIKSWLITDILNL